MTLKRFHLVMVVVWGLAFVPTVLWWKESVLWVALMSVYACMTSHFAAYDAARAEEANR